ncbi:Fic family protein [Parasediminibacterium sp. JCM 36343]|uniref:Fic family protein n=1 Tax=Parasediminibacterium sp. JCM 36343 TaxID=3374279 RepID=UPI00397B70A7
MELKILSDAYLNEYKNQLTVDIATSFALLKSKPHSLDNFTFYLANAAVHSSNIEGNTVSFDTYLKASEFKLHLKTKEMKEIEQLIAAYQFAKENELSLATLLKAHEILTHSILVKKERGKIRKVQVGVRSEGRLIYLAIEPEFVKQELEKFFADISVLLQSKLAIEEIFYYAAFIHLVFVNIHPFIDGNGRATRLVEKWFLAKMLGENAWCITSEKNYWDNRLMYYKNLQIGVNYYEVKYEKSIPFLLILPNAL